MKYIIFDFDGTLANSAEVYIDAWNTYSEKYQYLPLTMEDLEQVRHLDHYNKAKKFHFPMHKLSIILPKIYRYFRDHAHEVQLFDGIKETLENLSIKGYTIFILSSNKKENIESVLEQANVHAVSEILSARKMFGKDVVLKKLMKRHHLSPNEILYVGDELRDIQACNKLGIPFMWVSWGLDSFQLIENEHPKYVVHTPKEIVEKLNEMVKDCSNKTCNI